MESSVGWSNSIIGLTSKADFVDRVCVKFVAAIESKPADINGVFVSTDVPRASQATEHTSVLIEAQSIVGADAHVIQPDDSYTRDPEITSPAVLCNSGLGVSKAHM